MARRVYGEMAETIQFVINRETLEGDPA